MPTRIDQTRTLYGKHSGKVTNNKDPLHLGRITARVPSFSKEEDITWATPCVPYAGENIGIFFVPPVGANVWIEFENGMPDKPIFSGCFWSENQVPEKNGDPNIKMIKTEHATITINDKSNENRIEIKTLKNQKIIIEPDDIQLIHDGCSIKLTDREIFINGTNLQVKK